MRLISSSQKKLVGDFDNAFFPQLFAVEVEADGDVTLHLLHAQKLYDSKEFF